MNSIKIKRLVFAALFAALACAATFIHIPGPSMTNGYVNLGDCFVLLAGFCLGPVYGGLAGGIGSALTDLLGGYFLYAPATLIIKFFMAFCAALLSKALKKHMPSPAAFAISSAVGEVIMIGGYFVYELFLYGAAAVGSLPGNGIQAIAGLVSSVVIAIILDKNSAAKRQFAILKGNDKNV